MPSPQYRNPPAMAVSLQHPVLQRRQMLQAGGIALLGLGLSHLEGLRAAAPGGARGRQRSAIFVFLSGGLGQHDYSYCLGCQWHGAHCAGAGRQPRRRV